MTTRRRVREVVLQILFEDDMNPYRTEEAAQDFLERRMSRNKPLIEFGKSLLSGVRTHRAAIDANLGEHATNWSVKRMTPIDRNILRLAAFEIQWANVPAPVAINEAIELAKRYGQANSSAFVNGILDRLKRSKELVLPGSDPNQSVVSENSNADTVSGNL